MLNGMNPPALLIVPALALLAVTLIGLLAVLIMCWPGKGRRP